jgi:hypothetical protein
MGVGYSNNSKWVKQLREERRGLEDKLKIMLMHYSQVVS